MRRRSAINDGAHQHLAEKAESTVVREGLLRPPVLLLRRFSRSVDCSATSNFANPAGKEISAISKIFRGALRRLRSVRGETGRPVAQFDLLRSAPPRCSSVQAAAVPLQERRAHAPPGGSRKQIAPPSACGGGSLQPPTNGQKSWIGKDASGQSCLPHLIVLDPPGGLRLLSLCGSTITPTPRAPLIATINQTLQTNMADAAGLAPARAQLVSDDQSGPFARGSLG